MIGWNFPSNNNGQKTGLNDAGIETFRGDPIASLAREIIQNSIDAHQAGRGPVEVHFKQTHIPTSAFPGKDDFMNVLLSCKGYWEIPKAKAFFQNAIDVLEQEQISVLKISDYNTTGLTGSRKTAHNNWEILIKSTGASDKPEGAGGSFGIGKHAPFACTPLRTVFYNTFDIEGQFAFQGVSKLVTHINDNGETTQGTGFYGIKELNNPVITSSDVDEMFKRDKTGTDLFVFGFDGSSNWEERIIKSVLENFFVSIHHEKLSVTVGKTVINKITLGELITRYFSENKSSYCYMFYQAYVSEESIFKVIEDFEGMGKVELRILKGQNFPKRVAMVRQTGMLIFHRGHYQTPMKFAGVLHATGDAINSFLRSLEPPAHDKWEPERYPEPRIAESHLRTLNKWVHECIREISHDSIEEEYDFDGMQQFLPDDADDAPKQSDDASERTLPKEVDLVIRAAKKPNQSTEHSPSDETGDGDDDGTTPGGEEGDGVSTGGKSNGNPTDGAGDGDGSDSPGDGKPAGARTPISLKKVRAFCMDPATGRYKVIFEPSRLGNGMLELSIVGEVEQQSASVLRAQMSGIDVTVDSKGLIGPISFEPGSVAEVTVILDNNVRCALEVAAYEN